MTQTTLDLAEYANKLEDILDAIHYGRDIPHQELFRGKRAAKRPEFKTAKSPDAARPLGASGGTYRVQHGNAPSPGDAEIDDLFCGILKCRDGYGTWWATQWDGYGKARELVREFVKRFQ
jgi:hypothetical protein